jgi:hypothetical protein
MKIRSSTNQAEISIPQTSPLDGHDHNQSTGKMTMMLVAGAIDDAGSQNLETASKRVSVMTMMPKNADARGQKS